MIRIILTDDHAIVRAGLKKLILDEADMTIVGEAASAEEALSLSAKTNCYDVMLLDIALPDKNGIDTLKLLKKSNPDLPVLILSMFPEDQYAIRVMRAGAAGYVSKDSAPDELVTAIRKVASGSKYITPTLAEKLATEIEVSGKRPRHALLSDREFEILLGIAKGKSLTEIAEELVLSIKTVSTYRSRILDKMHMSKNSELARYAQDHHLLG